MGIPTEISDASASDKLFALLLTVLPHHLLSKAMHAATRWEYPPIAHRIIEWAIDHYGIDMSEAVSEDPRSYASFNAFFTRQLRPDARPVDTTTDSIISPVDAEVSQAGRMEKNLLVQAKGRYFTLEELLGDSELAADFHNGHFATLYLSPRDYHRIHMPLGGRLERMTHIPGRLFSVNHATTRAVPRLFARNERVVCLFETEAGPAAIILVGAIFVGSMDTVWAGTVTPADRRVSRWRYDTDDAGEIRLVKGDEMGRFNMGSTVILLFPKARIRWSDDFVPGTRVRMGQSIGKIGDSS